MHTRRYGLSLLLAMLCLLATPIASGATNASHTSQFPVTVTASNGKVVIPARPTSIVSLSPTATEMLYAIGAGHQVKAVDSDSDYPTDAPITKLGAYDLNVEAIAKYRPDLVIVALDPPNFIKQMTELKIPVLYEPTAANLTEAYQQYAQLGEATGNVSGATSEVTSVKAKIATIVRTTSHVAKGTTYYYEVDPTYYSVTSTTFVGQLFTLLGLKSIADSSKSAASSGGYPQLNAEYILKANPSYIFLADTICCKQSAKTVSARPGWSSLKAVKDRRVVELNDDIASRWGPRITILLQDVADVIKGHKSSTSS